MAKIKEKLEQIGGPDMDTHTDHHDTVVNNESLLANLTESFKDINSRIETHFDQARQADKIIFFSGCDDSRVFVPSELVQMDDGQQYLFVFIPAIGGGAPDGEVLTAIWEKYVEEGIDEDKFEVWVSQHGTEGEMHACAHGLNYEGKCACGARAARAAHADTLAKIAAGDEDLKHDAAHHLHVSPGLLDILNRLSADAQENADITVDGVSAGENPLRKVFYDHENHQMHVQYGEDYQLIQVPGAEAPPEGYQDPEVVCLSFGQIAASIPDDLVAGDVINSSINNDFNAVAVDRAGLIRAFDEISYAMGHHLHPHDNNFVNMKALLVMVDDDQHQQILEDIISEPDFQLIFGDMIRKLGGINIMNIDREEIVHLSF